METIYRIKLSSGDTIMLAAPDFDKLSERGDRFVKVQPIDEHRVVLGTPYELNPDNVVFAQALPS